MSDLYTVEYQNAYISEPSVKNEVGKDHGRVRRMYASITLAAELAVNDVIKMFKLPAHSYIVDARIIAPDDGTSGIVNVGWEANGVDAADEDGIFIGASEVDFGAGAIDNKLLGTAPGYNKKFGAETLISAKCTEVTVASSGDTIQLELFYVLD